MLDEDQWDRLIPLFDRLLAGEDPEQVFASESNLAVRNSAISLWRHHLSAGEKDYLGSPVDFAIAPVFHPGQILINRFRVESPLGSGGMGEVYLAWDQRMEERVALKTISRLLAPSHSIRRRFIAEVHNARRVTHPNVCRIHELFEDGEVVFFSMEYLEGALLSNLIGSLPPAHARSIVRQLSGGLHAAHQTGVVHGDFKPANVMIVLAVPPPGAPRAVIMDFGLAHALDRAVAPAADELSVRAGTVDYMAPELRHGEAPTVRSDIYAFGKVARQCLPKERIWDECIRPLPQDRPASLEKIVRFLQPQSSRRYWLAASALASAGGARYLFWPSPDPAVRLPLEARILVNGFRAAAGQLPGARLARALLLTALQQSPRIRAIADQDLLPRLPNGENLPLAGLALHDLLAQLRAAFWIEGALRRAGGRFSLDLQLLSTSGQQLVAVRSFRDQPSILILAQAAALWVRQTAGESSHSLESESVELAGYLSDVPEALQRYYQAMEHYALGEMDQALPLLQDAVRLDPLFAQAHNLLGLVANANGNYEEGFTHIGLAKELAGKLGSKMPEVERLAIESTYYRATKNPSLMVQAAKRNLALHPDEPRAHGQVAERLADTGDAAEAVSFARDAVRLAPDDWIQVLWLEYTLVESGQFAEALDAFQSSLSKSSPNRWLYHGVGCAYLGLERYADALQAFEHLPKDPVKGMDIAAAKILQGRLEIAIAAMEEQRFATNTAVNLHQTNAILCGLYFVTDRIPQARQRLRDMIDLPLFPPMALYLSCTASWARRLNDLETLAKVRTSLSAIARRWPDNAHTEAMAKHASGLELWQRGDFPNAESLLREASGLAADIWTLFDLAEFHTRLSHWDLAEEYWQKFDARRGAVLLRNWFPGILVLASWFRASAAYSRNDRRNAFSFSQKVLDSWAAANPRLSLVQSARTINSISRPL